MKARDVSVDVLPGQDSSVKADAHTTPSTRLWQRIALGMIVLTSAFLNFFHLDQIGYGNQYYAAAVKSMLEGWHTFFFVSFDPGGFVSVDKPPLGFWLQTASAKIFGFSGWSLLLPEAIAGILSVVVLYLLVRRVTGELAGLLAALALALSPISVVMNRSNNVDGLLVLMVLLAAWAVSRAAESGRLRWLLLGALLVGLGFNIKALEAYLVVPALGLVYLLGVPLRWRTRAWHLAVALALLLVVSFSWMTIVDLTPANQRPYVGSSSTNSELQLAIGYNGLDRLFGIGSTARAESSSSASTAPVGFTANENGSPGVLRLLNKQLGGQVSWLLPLALLGLVAAAWQTRRRLPLDRHQQALVLWGMWLLTAGIFFSVANFYHTYYLTMLAPAICALFGIGVLALWRDYRQASWQGWLLPLALVATAVVQAAILSNYASWSAWLTPLVVGCCLLAALVLTLARLKLSLRIPATFLALAVSGGALVLLLVPTVWSVISVQSPPSSSLPTAGPPSLNSSDSTANFPGAEKSGFTLPGMGNGGSNSGFNLYAQNSKLEQYLLSNQGSTRYLVATLNSFSAAPIILDTGQPVMALGGFGGADSILTTRQLAQLVSHNTVRFFYIQSGGGGGGVSGMTGMVGKNGQLTQWVQQSCKVVPQQLWSSGQNQGTFPPASNGEQPPPGSGFNSGMFTQQQQLYDCSNVH